MFLKTIKKFSILLFVFAIIGCNGQKFDVIITNTTVIDGSGSAGYVADIGIIGDKIIKIGDLSKSTAYLTFNGSGMVTSPGFIDVHTHSDRKVLDIPTGENYIFQGVTTWVTGNCGGSKLSTKEYFEAIIEKKPTGNIVALYGHNTVRRNVMGMADRAPTAEELDKMKALVDQAMKEGAAGLSTGLLYTPGVYSETEEIIELNKMVGKYGGIYASHIRDQGLGMYDSVREAIRIGEEGGTRVQVSHLKLSTDYLWGDTEKMDKVFKDAQARGVEVYSDQYPYIATSTSMASIFPAWSLADGKIIERLADKTTRAKIKSELFNWGRMVTYKNRDMLQVVQIANYGPDESFEGKNLRQILEMRKVKVTMSAGKELAMEVMSNGGAGCVFFQMNEDDVKNIMNYDYNMIASDGSILTFGKGVVHPRSYGTFPRVLGKYVREDKALSLESAIHKMTEMPAKSFRLEGRGLLKENYFADLVVFDPATIKDQATFQSPHQYPVGIKYIFVNGKLTVDSNILKDNRAGRPLYGPGYGK